MSKRSMPEFLSKLNKPIRSTVVLAGIALSLVCAVAVYAAISTDSSQPQSYFDTSRNLLFAAFASGFLYWFLIVQKKTNGLSQLCVALDQCNDVIARSQSMDELLSNICSSAVKFGGVKMAWISMADPSSGMVKPVASYGAGECYLDGIHITTNANDQWGCGPVGTAIRENRPVWCKSFQKEPMLEPWHERGREYNWGSVASLPLEKEGEVVGAFNLYYEKKESFDQAVQVLMQKLAQDVSAAMNKFTSDMDKLNAEKAFRNIEAFNQAVLNSLDEAIVVLDRGGTIVQTNLAWQKLATKNGFPLQFHQAAGSNYLDIFDSSCSDVSSKQLSREDAAKAEAGVLDVLSGQKQRFEMEYPLRSQNEEHWYCMHVSPLRWEHSGAVVSHKVITERKLAEISLRESEARYGTLFSNNSVAMLLVDPADGQIVDANVQACVFYGWDLLTLRSMNITEINTLPKETLLEKLHLTCKKVAEKFSFQHRLASGDLRDVDVFSGPVTVDGRLLLLSSIIDVTERKKTEQRERNAQAMVRGFLEHMPGLAYVKNQDRRLLMANQAFEAFLGMAPDEVIGRTNLEVFPDDFGQKIDADDQRIFETGQTTILEESYQNRRYETLKFLIEDESHEKLLGGITLDITQRHLLATRQQALLDINEMSTQMPESELLHKGLGIVEMLTNSEVALLYCVDEEKKTALAAYTNNALALSAVAPLLADDEESAWVDCLYEGQPVTYNDYVQACKDHGLDEVPSPIQRLLSIPVVEDGQVRMIIGVGNKAFDYDEADVLSIQMIGHELWRITRSRRAEEALMQQLEALQEMNQRLETSQLQLLQSEKMASIGQLAAGVAHEINNPISYVQSNFNSLKEYVDQLLVIDSAYRKVEKDFGAEHAQSFEPIQRIKTEADYDFMIEDLPKLIGDSIEGLERVRSIVKDLKDFSRVGEAEWQWADLHPEIESTLKIASNEIKYKIDVKREYGELPLVYCVPGQLNQVFLNLILNAAQAIKERGSITIRTGCDHQFVWFDIQDDGCGIAKENLQRIFDPFYTSKPNGQGTGLGLPLAWGIVQRHKGKIEVESALGVGTKFRVTLPINLCVEFSEGQMA